METTNDNSLTVDSLYTANLSNGSTAKIVKRTRKPWVYKSEYDRLQNKYRILSWIAAIGWLAFLITLKFIL